jgi:hypothetical protein
MKELNMIGVDLEKALIRQKEHSELQNPDETLAAFQRMLKQDNSLDEEILQTIFKGGNEISRALQLDLLKHEHIYNLEQIKKLCTKYRLRFLDTKYFKGDIPREAISKIKAIQKEQNSELKGFKMIAPAPMFNLENKDKDPLLMLPLGNNQFYLIHKWGQDLHPLRALLVFPFRSFQTLLFSVALAAALVVSLFPDSIIMGPYGQSSWNIRLIFFFYLFLAFSGLTALYGFSRMKNFNSELWNSKYID